MSRSAARADGPREVFADLVLMPAAANDNAPLAFRAIDRRKA